METVVTLLAVGFLGSWLNKNGKTQRDKVPSVISPHDVPNGPIIYESHRLEEVDREMKQRGSKKYTQMLKNRYSDDLRIDTKIEPVNSSTHLTHLDELSSDFNIDTTQLRWQKEQENNPSGLYDPKTGKLLPVQVVDPDKTAMFQLLPSFSPSQEFGIQPLQNSPNMFYSSLSDLVTEKTHQNMLPSFGSKIPNNSISSYIIDHFAPVSDDLEPFSKERENIINSGVNNIRPTQTSDFRDKTLLIAEQMVNNSQQYSSPSGKIRDSPMNTLEYRSLPKNIDQLRGNQNSKMVEEIPVLAGKSTIYRAVDPEIPKIRHDLTHTPLVLPSRSIQTVEPVRSILRVTKDNTIISDRPSNLNIQIPRANMRNENFDTSFDSEKELNYMGPVKLDQKDAQWGKRVIKLPYGRETENRISNITGGSAPPVVNISTPQTTYAQLLSQNPNRTLMKQIDTLKGAYLNQNVVAPVTMRSIIGKTNYLGIPYIPKGMTYDTVFSVAKGDKPRLDYMGVSQGEILPPVVGKTERLVNPKTTKGQFSHGYNPDGFSLRDAKMDIKDITQAPGRMGSGLVQTVETMPIGDVDLKPDYTEREIYTNTRVDHTTDRLNEELGTINREVRNDRLDTDVTIEKGDLPLPQPWDDNLVVCQIPKPDNPETYVCQ